MTRSPRLRSFVPCRALLVLLPAALVLAGCAPDPVSEQSYPGLPDNVKITGAPDVPIVRWQHKPVSVTISTWGSSSCPAVATDMQLDAERILTISFETESGQECTADLVPTTHVLRLPDEAQRAPVTIMTTFDGVTNETRHVLG